MGRMGTGAALAFAMLLSGCGPRMEGRLIAGSIVEIKNADRRDFTITRIVANKSETWSCTQNMNRALHPGDTATATFFLCGTVSSIQVTTDRGIRNMVVAP